MSNELMIRDEALMPTTFDGLMRQAQSFIKSRLLPDTVSTPEAAVLIMLKGRELGIPPLTALANIAVIKGKPTINAQMMGALILSAGHGYHPEVISNEKCVLVFQRKGGAPYKHEFTMEDAKRAGLLSNDVWTKYPKAMLFSRCMSAGARVMFPDVIAGMYTAEELGEAVTMDTETGEIVPNVIVIEPERKADPPVTTTGNGHAAQTEAVASGGNGQHWTRTQEAGAFMKRMAEKTGLGYSTIQEAMGVKAITAYTGTIEQAEKAIDDWVYEQQQAATEPDPKVLTM